MNRRGYGTQWRIGATNGNDVDTLTVYCTPKFPCNLEKDYTQIIRFNFTRVFATGEIIPSFLSHHAMRGQYKEAEIAEYVRWKNLFHELLYKNVKRNDTYFNNLKKCYDFNEHEYPVKLPASITRRTYELLMEAMQFQSSVFKCTLCPYSTLNNHGEITKHMAISHALRSKIQCSKCGKHFATEAHYEQDLNVHIKPFSARCPNCRQSFAHRETFKKHFVVCLLSTRACVVCDILLPNKKAFLRHTYTAHPIIRPHRRVRIKKRSF